MKLCTGGIDTDFSIKKSLFLVKTIPTFLVKVDLFMFERKTWMILLMWVFLKQLQCLEFVSNLRIILKIYILHVLFQSEGTSLTFGPFFAAPVNDFWNAGMSEGFTVQLRSCFTPCFLPLQHSAVHVVRLISLGVTLQLSSWFRRVKDVFWSVHNYIGVL